MTFKECIFLRFQQILNEKTILIEHTLSELRFSASNETKSSAGDKHETALALLQIEQENKRKQLQDLQIMAQRFNQINPSLTSPKASFGSLVKTDGGYFFISVALGKLNVEEKNIFAISLLSPFGNKILGLGVNENFSINGKKYTILEVE